MASQCQAMVLINLSHVTCLLSLIHLSYSHRRIQGGAELDIDKKYAVYLLKAPKSPMRYIGWICGGAIVSEWYIITSAACVQDVKHVYAIAGYRKYVKTNDIDNDQCTKNLKKKIVFSCVPKSYNFEYHDIEKWAHSDIAVVKVESKYDFNDQSYLQHCSYIPAKIDINYDGKYQEPGTDTIALGWGHSRHFRQEKDIAIYNENQLKYAPLLIVTKSVCKDAYHGYENLQKTIDKYMLCASGAGNLDDMGDLILRDKHKVDGCVTEEQQKKGLRGIPCEGLDKDIDPYDEVYKSYSDEKTARRNFSETDVLAEKNIYDEFASKGKRMISLTKPRRSGYRMRSKLIKKKTRSRNTEGDNHKKDEKLDKIPDEIGDDILDEMLDDKTADLEDGEIEDDLSSEILNDEGIPNSNNTEKPNAEKAKVPKIHKHFNSTVVGICQNDHGGPLVTWVGARELLIGVATAFIVSGSSHQCKGPYLFTSTQCNSAFLDCILSNSTQTYARRKLCDSPDRIGFEMVRRHISWADHPAGPADNEIIEGRPQISIQKYYYGNPEQP